MLFGKKVVNRGFTKRMKFIGSDDPDLSLGFKENYYYDLVFFNHGTNNSWICVTTEDNSLGCCYHTFGTLLENWSEK